MTRTQILQALASSWQFVVEFIIDNNPNAVTANLSAIDALPASPSLVTRQQLFDTILALPADEMSEVLSVPYIDNATNYTGGFLTDLENGILANSGQQRGALAIAIVTGITTLGAGFFGMQTSQNQADAQAAAAASAQAYLEAQQQNKILGMDPLVFAVVSVVIGAILVTTIIVLNRKR